ncbi:hypothetical protein B0A48_16401 [Cryoendolithus antarcticus]|uniref:Uncharacterized protein n=1 Tax=Cryoendolithus antarcticus TaxID=1507870 RepID=A0A1V8SE87_9PEZI|nr:hypothetical protein B0A48_16401 [Cryoendolithus antarcticus]
MAKDAATHDLSSRTVELLVCVCKSLNAKPTSLVNIEKFAELGGFANINSARANLHRVLKEVMESGGATAGTAGEDGAEGEKATPKKRGRKVTKEDDDEGETPAKKTKATPKRGKKVSEANEGEEDEELMKVKDEEGAGEKDEET